MSYGSVATAVTARVRATFEMLAPDSLMIYQAAGKLAITFAEDRSGPESSTDILAASLQRGCSAVPNTRIHLEFQDMSAQQIPNLLTLRGGPRSRGGRARGRGRGGPHSGNPELQAQLQKDRDVQSTDTDAAVSRLSAVDLGYLHDPFASLFVNGPGTRRLPIINRGTYTRTTALDILINAFLSHPDSTPTVPQTKQIISLGAGTDTRYFKLRAQNKHRHIIYHEFDFVSVSITKERIMKNNGLLWEDEGEAFFKALETVPGFGEHESEWGLERSKDGITETTYCFHPLDLRHLLKTSKPVRGLRTDVPTLIVSECCLCYLEVETSREVVKWFTSRIPSIGLILYEPIGLDDSFGQMMVSNLAARNITMPSLEAYKTLPDQKARLAQLGFTSEGGGQEAETVEQIWEKWISIPEKERVDALEGLDEVEEWQMLARHYAIAWGWRGTTGWEGLATLRA
ncbi:LCM-domain-containing protein [Mollisia scopiformis]|uniref:Leucine carboxyl methyltransferase 1 n=1 Tax=Mollisia scopiformis TaxID=149040 RepID=A0A194X965_MOLSC|nr:LCM-domain-containing protein [Mollisia scopiformis]KUJ16708.1 LCM-domain-containing protein [Mollisia scopiformis]